MISKKKNKTCLRRPTNEEQAPASQKAVYLFIYELHLVFCFLVASIMLTLYQTVSKSSIFRENFLLSEKIKLEAMFLKEV